MTETNIGIDISKDHLDVHRLPGDERRRFDNSKAGHKALIRWIGDTPARVVYEPTGRYHRTLERALAAAGMPIAKVNPRQARRFAEATGNLAKTDALDAAMLTRMGAVLSLEARPVTGLSVILCAGSFSIIRPRTYRRIGWRIGFWPRTTRAAVASILRPLD